MPAAAPLALWAAEAAGNVEIFAHQTPSGGMLSNRLGPDTHCIDLCAGAIGRALTNRASCRGGEPQRSTVWPRLSSRNG